MIKNRVVNNENTDETMLTKKPSCKSEVTWPVEWTSPRKKLYKNEGILAPLNMQFVFLV